MTPKLMSHLPLHFVFVAALFSLSLLSIYQQEQLLQRRSLDWSMDKHFQQQQQQHETHHETSDAAERAAAPRGQTMSSSSSSILLEAALNTPRPIADSPIDHTFEQQRCTRYGLTYTPRTARRRIFWGASIADDTWHIIAAQALETYGLFHTVAFVESNRTSMGNRRSLRFDDGSVNKQRLMNMFGDQAKVTVDYYVNEDEGPDQLVSLEREHAQRALILHRWKLNGMTPHDIGYLSDTDEMFSRDFLRAMQVCDVPQFRSEGNKGHSRCAEPKVYGLAAIFEGSPECVSAEEIYHPALMIGECIEGIGNSTLHPTPTRNNHRTYSWRTDNYTYHTYYSALHNESDPPRPKTLPSNVYFPLFNAADFRRTPGGFFYGNDDVPLYIGYHVHNFFDDIGVMRQKYLTYGHAQTDALTKPLGDLNREVNLMVRCAVDGDDSDAMDGSVMKIYKSKDDRRKHAIMRRKGGLEFLKRANYGWNGGAVPLAFRIQEYVDARHDEMVAMIHADETARLRVASKRFH
ncbi:hypothetical protein HJC23_006429 [Cyclotella cryptica]|uniref:Hexosyltransferase n=1 Tax=Cyclotella cryptica TaxID=29204 RepID=A0ABD3QUY1_9STRA|eukprot:CCRYP_001830-RA/>CCRYP_001830-RA protein AED:0.03 eAED:0.03 QI:242/1/1/1/1/1/2/234/518